MKKTSKKLVSLLTILSFLLTLVPAAVFAAPADTTPSKDQSYVETEDDSLDVGNSTDVRIGLRNATGADAEATGYDVYVWAGSNSASNDSVEFTNVDKTAVKGVWKVKSPVKGVNALKATFNKAGEYQLNAAIVPNDSDPKVKIEKLSDLAEYAVNEKAKAKVDVSASNTIKAVDVYDGSELIATFTADNSVEKNKVVSVVANGLTPKKLTIKAWKDAKKTIAADKNTEVHFDTNSANLQLNKTSDKIDYTGKVDVELTGDVYGTYKFYVTVGDVDGTIEQVKVEKSTASIIELSKAAQKPFAWDNDFKNGEEGMKDFIRFAVKDINGNVLSTTPTGEEAFTNDPGDFIKVLDKPANMKLEGKDFRVDLVKDKDYFTLVPKKELKVGKYSVQVALQNGKKAVANFEIAKFGTAKELKIAYDTETVQLNADVNAPSIVLVDENGVEKKAAKRTTIGYNGYAVAKFEEKDGSFKVEKDEKYLGSKITVTAVAEREGLVAKADLTVAQDGRGIKFLSDKGAVGANNKVDFQLVDGAGKTVNLTGKYDASAIVLEKVSDDTAKVSAAVTSTGDLQEKGLGTLSLTADKACTAEFAVYVRDEDKKYYAGNLKYTFGKTASKADTTVVMMIGSKDVIVDNNVVTVDTAALIKNDRTFVPYRALAEAFGAKVEWDQATKTVTTEMDGKKVVMTIDKKEYKVNDKEMTMDVAPYISGDRTLVPVRFVAEALGFKVTPHSNGYGTACVVFNK